MSRRSAGTHDEPDEQVYLGLAREMSWNLSRYTTMHVPRFRQLPYSIYRQPLFHQPPLYPLILKVGEALGSPAVTGLVFNNLAMSMVLYLRVALVVTDEHPARLGRGSLRGPDPLPAPPDVHEPSPS